MIFTWKVKENRVKVQGNSHGKNLELFFQGEFLLLIGSDEGNRVFAGEAEKGRDYTCPECGGFLRLRKGRLRTPHFYHTRGSSTCSLSGKSATHLALQEHLLRLLANEGAVLEHPFPEIGRIADVACLTTKKIFEIQCSPLSLEEAERRTGAYEAIGYTVIWILHEKSFNRHRLSPAERFLRGRGAYFSDFTQKGEGAIYDQIEELVGKRRVRASHRRGVDLLACSFREGIPRFFHEGDWSHRLLAGEERPTFKKGETFFQKLGELYLYLLDQVVNRERF